MLTTKNRILVVDDEPDIVANLSHLLSGRGYEVNTAFNGEEALNSLKNKTPDLILLDLKMPGISGFEVASIVKVKYPEIKIVVISGYVDEVEGLVKDKFLEAAFLKPVRLQDLYQKLREIFSRNPGVSFDSTPRQGIKANVLLLKAKLLFIEPSLEIYHFLKGHFQDLERCGQNYILDIINNAENLEEKIILSRPDILAVNASFLRKLNMNIRVETLELIGYPKEIVLYNFENSEVLSKIDLEKLTKGIETACLKNGLLEIEGREI